MSERMKVNHYLKRRVNSYFWRTYDQQEIDLVEEKAEDLFAFEFKWNKNTTRIPAAWRKTYTDSTFELIHKGNYLPFVLAEEK